MDPTRLMTMPATITPRVADGRDELNDVVLAEGDPIVLPGGPGNGVWIEQNLRDETRDANNVRSESWRLFALPSLVLDAGAKVEVDGVEYEVDGPPWRATNPRLRTVSHIEATLRRVS